MSAIDVAGHELYRPEREILGGLSLLISKFYPVSRLERRVHHVRLPDALRH